MGRTGRRELPPEMWFVIREDEPEVRAMLPTTIPWKLLQGIALVQLYLEERWVEPPRLDRLPFSLLYHQTMSTLASCGELSHGRWPTGCCGCITSTGSRRRTTGCCSGISSPQTTFSRRSRAV